MRASSDRPEPAEIVIGVDVGTSAVKVAAFRPGTGAVTTVSREYGLEQPNPGWQVQDPELIANAVADALAECAASCGPDQVAAVSLSAAMHGLVGMSAALQPLTPLLTWADGRAIAQSARLRESGAAVLAYRTSGVPNHPMTPLAKLIWFAENEPRLCSRVRYWVGLKDFVLLRLTGSLATELSSATGTGLLDRDTLGWSPTLLDLARVTVEQLPPILPTTASLRLGREAAGVTGLRPGLPVVVGAGDGPLGNLGSGALASGVAGLSIGTSAALRLAVDRPVLDPDGRLFCYALTGQQWVVGGATSNGGSVVRWAGGVFGPEPAADDRSDPETRLLELAAGVPPRSEGLVMLPYLLAERGPLWDPTLRGAFLGLRPGHTRAHFARAAVEGVALQLWAILGQLGRFGRIEAVHATGGAFRSALWQQVVADVLDLPLVIAADAAGTALGAAALGLVSLGRETDLVAAAELLRPSRRGGRTVTPAVPGAYDEVRASIPRLLRQYAEVSALFERDRPGGRDPGPGGPAAH